ncbi:MAG: HlyD family efflux transporter periplasmic adaptor subunit [Lysobacterales bacterium]|nr:MAG: HlyD family efflux transporter periplasmic adaptor subunit [Xanthomonadales bacterium]
MQAAIRDTSAQDVPIARAGGKRWLKWLLPAGVAALLGTLLVSALTTWISAEASVSADRIRTAVVERGDLVRDLNVQGRVVAAVSPTLYSPATGSVTLEVTPGDTVGKGQVLAAVESPELRSEFLQEQATLDRLVAELEREKIQARMAQVTGQQTIDLAKVKLNAAEREMRRADESIETNAISQIDYERARDELARARVEHAHAVQDAQLESESLAFESRTRQLAVDRQQLVVAELQRRIDDLAVRSPVDGIVGNVAVTQKAVVDQNTPLITVVDLSAFEVEVRIPEAYADDLGIGLGADVEHSQAHYRGELVSLSAEVIDSEVTGRIRFAGEPPPGLRQNQRVTVRVMMDELLDVLKIQRGSFTDGGSGRYAFVLGDDGLAVRRPVQLGARSVAEVEIVSGLAEGERVIISSVAEFEDHDTIQVVN